VDTAWAVWATAWLAWAVVDVAGKQEPEERLQRRGLLQRDSARHFGAKDIASVEPFRCSGVALILWWLLQFDTANPGNQI
jgi:hypothetical protein